MTTKPDLVMFAMAVVAVFFASDFTYRRMRWMPLNLLAVCLYCIPIKTGPHCELL